jgi:hypothetical protein
MVQTIRNLVYPAWREIRNLLDMEFNEAGAEIYAKT